MGWVKEANLWDLVPGEARVLGCVMKLTSGAVSGDARDLVQSSEDNLWGSCFGGH